MSTWCRSAVNRASLSRFAACRTRSSPCDTRVPALGPERVVLAVFPLVSPLPSTASAAPALFGGFVGNTGLSDFPSSCISGLRPQPSLSGPPPRPWMTGKDGISRFSRMKVPCIQGSSTPRGPLAARASAAGGVAFHSTQRCRRPGLGLFRGSMACLHVPLTNASGTPSRTPPHGAGSPWLAKPSGRGRNRPSRITPLGRPPAQNPACPIRAPGSYLGCRTSAPGCPRRAGSMALHSGPLPACVNQRK